ncbi:PadR family transcriptional regulator [Propionicimonas sp.]|uniref:PadR family transcriptional regulator n=1 Tax=Propionicimonas sp. TaxID=1955623 RepID=UPI00182B834B|nr:PadR family transcriptional regulator [Propionicimonas sp.]MBU3976093.1 PadR family transcriptional regulator [Actinomycetota bacterium]MBA3020906.1 PadR family transcriptional regulator [Propionicimonas sp.]MBU3985283.1 PadR family transcriptional regulator [Actinomycetota bacterium]MBU4008273.1 PadR family transcriptional regulator [Actinomycetota bacterium]MBU4064513.1 PadR family transcriptional regulator [Actinomycetota bacterium]
MSHTHGAGFIADPTVFLRKLADWGFNGAGPGSFGPQTRVRRGDTRAAILKVLAEKPMHGYQIIQELSQRSGGAWRPSAGSVYPTLQLLADEGLIEATETGGKKVFALTEAGKAAVEELAEETPPWDVAAAVGDFNGLFALRDSGARLASAVMQVGRSGEKEQIEAAVEILNATRKQIYSLLAQD